MKRLSAEALTVLESGLSVDGRAVRITSQLDRKLYVEVNSALEALGGKWTRGAKAHVFDEEPADALDRILVDGGFHDVKRDLDQFFTPPALARQLVERADVKGQRCLEPSAGHGAIADAMVLAGAAAVTCVEKDAACCAVLRSKGLDVIEGDFLMCGPLKMRPDRTVMNPPFSRQRDIDHVLAAFSRLRPGGVLVAVMSGGVEFRSDRKTTEFRALAEKHGAIERLPDASFRESGTDVRTVVVTMHKR